MIMSNTLKTGSPFFNRTVILDNALSQHPGTVSAVVTKFAEHASIHKHFV